MNFDENISMLSMAFYQVLLVSGPILALALGIGLLIGIIQAATSINEMTLSFVPIWANPPIVTDQHAKAVHNRHLFITILTPIIFLPVVGAFCDFVATRFER